MEQQEGEVEVMDGFLDNSNSYKKQWIIKVSQEMAYMVIALSGI